MSGRRLAPFYVLVATQTLSLVGSRMTAVGLGLWLFTNTGQTTPLLLVVFFMELPGVLFGGLAGVLVDRWPRRRVMALADAGQGAATIALFLMFAYGGFSRPALYALAFLQGAFAIFQAPAINAAMTMMVPAAHRERANGLKQMAFPLAGAVAPVFAGALFAAVDVEGIILIDVATFFIAVAALAFIAMPPPPPSAESVAVAGFFWRELGGAARYVGQRRGLLLLVGYMTLMNFFLNGPLELAIPFLLTLTASETTTGAILGVMSLGALTGGALIALWGGTRPRIHTILGGSLLTGTMFIVAGLTRSPALLAGALFLLLMPLPAGGALFTAILQRKTPADMQGRIFALVEQAGFVGATASFLLVGPLVDRWLEPAVGGRAWRPLAPLLGAAPGAGMALVLIATGILILLTTIAVYASPTVRGVERDLPDQSDASSPA